MAETARPLAGPLHPFLDHPRPLAIAHRGGALEAEENTQAAFAHAAALGYSHIETDVRATADGVAVVHHDETLLRMYGDPRRVADLTWAEASRLATAGGERLPRLDSVLEAFPGLYFNVEAKDAAAVAPMAEALRRAGALARVGVGAFDARHMAELRRRLGPGLCWSPSRSGVARVWLAGWGLPARVEFTVLQVPPRWRGIAVVTPRFLKAAHARGIPVQVWTVDAREEMERLIGIGVDGIMTDRPTLLREVLRGRGLWPGD